MRYFKDAELSCNCGCGKMITNGTFLHMLVTAREIANIPFKVNSAYRCPEHNSLVGGKPSSAHKEGVAMDISCIHSRERAVIVNALVYAGFKRIGIYKSFIHFDLSSLLPSPRIWLGD